MSEHRGVPAAEKYAELLANGQERPRCACHQETMRWNKHSDVKAGGYWECSVKRNESTARYGKSEKGKEVSRIWRSVSPKWEASQLRYFSSPKGRATRQRVEDRRLRIGGFNMSIGFTQTEVEAMLSGTSD